MHSVLLVDDEPFVRLSLASMRDWEEDGFDLRHEAANGREALAVLAAHPEIDIVLLDISMPVMDGIEFLKQLAAGSAAEHCLPAVIVLSAYDEFRLVRTAFTLGAKDYILKAEVQGDTLLAMLKKTAAGIETPHGRSSAIIEQGHIEAIRSQILRDLLVEPPAGDCEEVLASLGVALRPPFSLCAFWIRDFAEVAERFRGEGLARFSSMMRRSLQQLLARRGEGEVVSVRPDHAVVFFLGPEEAARGFCVDAAESIERYLSVRAEFAVGEPCQAATDVAEAYRGALAARRVESRIVVAARRFIREHHADPEISLADIAQSAGVSKNHMSWEFARETGATLTDYLAQVRIEEAKGLLASTNLKVYEVGERVGYPNVEHFSRIFKKLTGASPSTWGPRQ